MTAFGTDLPPGTADLLSGDPAAPPRALASGPWRFDKTAASIRQVVRDGILGTATPSHPAAVTDADADAELLSGHVPLLPGAMAWWTPAATWSLKPPPPGRSHWTSLN